MKGLLIAAVSIGVCIMLILIALGFLILYKSNLPYREDIHSPISANSSTTSNKQK